MDRKVELEQEGYRFVYDPEKKTLMVNGIILPITLEESEEDGIQLRDAYISCTACRVRRQNVSGNKCGHLNLARNRFFPHLGRQVFLYYAKLHELSVGERHRRTLVDSLEATLVVKEAGEYFAKFLDKIERGNLTGSMPNLLDDYIQEVEAEK